MRIPCISECSGLSIFSVPALYLKDPQMEDKNLSGTSSYGWGDLLKQVAWVLANQRQEKLSINK